MTSDTVHFARPDCPGPEGECEDTAAMISDYRSSCCRTHAVEAAKHCMPCADLHRKHAQDACR
jgi:hypothetical protein